MAGRICQTPFLHDLQQQSQHIRVRLFQLIQKYQTVGPAAHCLCQFSTVFIPHITGRRSDQPGNRLFFHIFRHVQTDHRIPAAVNFLCQRTAQLRFSHTCRPCKQQTGNGPVSVPDTGVAPADSLRHCIHRALLTDDPAAEKCFQFQKPLPFRRGQLPQRDPCPGRYNCRDLPSGNTPGAPSFSCLCRKLLHSVPQLRGLLKPPLPYGRMQFHFQFLPGSAASAGIQLFQTAPCRRLIQQINGLVRQIQIRQIPH